MKSNNMEYKKNLSQFLGIDKHGFQYFESSYDYIYQKYPNFDFFINGKNMKNRKNGWICHMSVWNRIMKRLLV